MYGCKSLAVPIFALALAGCTDAESSQGATDAQTALGEAFDETYTGTLHGAVTWQGERPAIALLKILGLPGEYPFNVRQDQPNPNAPKIDSSGAIEGAIVFLRR